MKKKLPMIAGVEPACERCAFAHNPPDEFKGGDPVQRCFRYPPQVNAADEDFPGNSAYPEVCDLEWCGEFRKAEYEPEAEGE